MPHVPGIDRKNIVVALNVLSGKTEVGQRVVVIGGGIVGCEVAEFLADKGKKVTIVEMLVRFGQDIAPVNSWVIVGRLRELGVDMLTLAKLEAVTDSGVTINGDGQRQSVEADTIEVVPEIWTCG